VKPDGEKAVVKRISMEFKTTESRCRRSATKLSYGEAAIVLSLAQTLPGGITDASIRKY